MGRDPGALGSTSCSPRSTSPPCIAFGSMRSGTCAEVPYASEPLAHRIGTGGPAKGHGAGGVIHLTLNQALWPNFRESYRWASALHGSAAPVLAGRATLVGCRTFKECPKDRHSPICHRCTHRRRLRANPWSRRSKPRPRRQVPPGRSQRSRLPSSNPHGGSERVSERVEIMHSDLLSTLVAKNPRDPLQAQGPSQCGGDPSQF